MTLKTNENDPNNKGRQRLEIDLRTIWLGVSLSDGTPYSLILFFSVRN